MRHCLSGAWAKISQDRKGLLSGFEEVQLWGDFTIYHLIHTKKDKSTPCDNIINALVSSYRSLMGLSGNMGTIKLENVIVPSIDAVARWDIDIVDGKVISRNQAASPSSSCPSVLLPPLCHPHIHLDKPYILTSNHPPSASHPDYTDLTPKTGSFEEALANTSAAKTRYTPEDLYLRGAQLLAESRARHGVTSMRVFVEVDHAVQLKTLEAAVRLKGDFAHLLRIQICVFAQDPIFTGDHGEENRALVLQALDRYAGNIEALGTTPYVEQGPDEEGKAAAERRNIGWAVSTALERGLHLDFHLDYNLKAGESSVPAVCDQLEASGWVARAGRSRVVTIGHCTQLTGHSAPELRRLADRIRRLDLPVHFVGLPTSDLFMMGRPTSRAADPPHARPRGTLQVPAMIRDLGLDACLGVNNVGNAFTPYGDGDPLQLACWGTGLYQAGTPADAALLYECVSVRAARAVGLLPPPLAEGEEQAHQEVPVPGLLIQNVEDIVLPGKEEGGSPLRVPARQRLSVRDVVWDPPGGHLRRVVG